MYLKTAMDVCQALEATLQEKEVPGLQKAVQTLLSEINHDLGCIATETNQPEAALRHFSEFNRSMIKFAGDEPQREDMRLAVSWNELGNAYMMNKQWTQAADCFIRSMDTLKQLNNFKKVDLSFPQINLGFSYWLQGRLDEADEVLSDILAAREAAYGINDRESFM